MKRGILEICCQGDILFFVAVVLRKIADAGSASEERYFGKLTKEGTLRGVDFQSSSERVLF